MKGLTVKAIHKKTGEWVYGFLYPETGNAGYYIISTNGSGRYCVIEETICKSTGLTVPYLGGLELIFEHDVAVATIDSNMIVGEIICSKGCYYLEDMSGGISTLYQLGELIDSGWDIKITGNSFNRFSQHKQGQTKPAIVCVSGKARHGKDSFAGLLAECLKKEHNIPGVLVTHYGDLLKYVCRAFHNWDGEKNEEGRTMLQHVGTDIIRTQNPSYWARFLSDQLNFSYGNWGIIIIPDCRFKNEMSSNFDKEKFDIYEVRIVRPNYESELTKEQQNHASETELDDYDFDYTFKACNMEELALSAETMAKIILSK